MSWINFTGVIGHTEAISIPVWQSCRLKFNDFAWVAKVQLKSEPPQKSMSPIPHTGFCQRTKGNIPSVAPRFQMAKLKATKTRK